MNRLYAYGPLLHEPLQRELKEKDQVVNRWILSIGLERISMIISNPKDNLIPKLVVLWQNIKDNRKSIENLHNQIEYFQSHKTTFFFHTGKSGFSDE